jgi:D-serine deaminase-like pyridoxal phosphate-dependent protein
VRDVVRLAEVALPRLRQRPLATPALLVDLDAFDANVAAMDALLAASGKVLRPHVKTHRTPALALRQLGPNTRGVTCSTVGEAEAMVRAGIDEILIANEVIDPGKLDRLASLAADADMSVAVDSAEGVDRLSAAAVRAGHLVRVLVDVDILIHRCGVGSPKEAVVLAERVASRPGLVLDGVMGYEGRLRPGVADRQARIADAYRILDQSVRAIREAGHAIRTVSAAGTSTIPEALADPTITELQAGVYAVMEPELIRMGLPFRCAVAVRATVISQHSDRVVLDAGRRSIGMEYGPPVPIGIDARSISLSDEHAIVWTDGDRLALGSQVDLVPAQVRTTFNLHDEVVAVRGDEIVATWPIAARGASR